MHFPPPPLCGLAFIQVSICVLRPTLPLASLLHLDLYTSFISHFYFATTTTQAYAPPPTGKLPPVSVSDRDAIQARRESCRIALPQPRNEIDHPHVPYYPLSTCCLGPPLIPCLLAPTFPYLLRVLQHRRRTHAYFFTSSHIRHLAIVLYHTHTHSSYPPILLSPNCPPRTD